MAPRDTHQIGLTAGAGRALRAGGSSQELLGAADAVDLAVRLLVRAYG